MFGGVGDIILADLGQVEVHVRAVLVAEGFASGDDGGQVRIAVAVAVGHAAAPEHLGGVQEAVVLLLEGLELIEEIAELADEEGVGLGQAAELFRIAVMVGEAVACLQNADLRNAAGIALAADAAGDHAGGVCAQRHDHEVVEETVVLTGFGHAELALEAGGLGGRHGGLGHIEPFVSTAGAFLHLAHGGEVFVQLAAVGAAQLVVHAFGVIGHEVEDAATAHQAATDGFLAVLLHAKEHVENLLRIALRRELDAVFGPCERGTLDGHLQRGEASGIALHLGDELVGGHGVAEGSAIARYIRACEPHLLAVVVLAQHHRVVQAADGRDVRAMFLQRHQRLGKLIIRARFLNLPGQCVHPVWDVEKHTALGLRRRWKRAHRIE